MHSMSCLPALAEADVSLEERWLLQDVAACRCVILALGERPRLPQELCQEVLPWDGVPCPTGAGREGDLVPPAASRVVVWMDGWRGPRCFQQQWHLPTPT